LRMDSCPKKRPKRESFYTMPFCGMPFGIRVKAAAALNVPDLAPTVGVGFRNTPQLHCPSPASIELNRSLVLEFLIRVWVKRVESIKASASSHAVVKHPGPLHRWR
jgi:hypothetical protein